MVDLVAGAISTSADQEPVPNAHEEMIQKEKFHHKL
jgi:hypothetical protein